MRDPFGLLEETQGVLAEATEVAILAKTPGWKRVLGYLDSLVAEAAEERDGNLSADTRLAWNLQWRYLQRKSVRDALVAYVATAEAKRDEILEEMNEGEGNVNNPDGSE